VSREGRIALALGALYLSSRLFGLTTLPLFLDETTHIRWAVQIASGEKLLRPWNYGKGLSVFANALLFPWAFDHYLWASRALTVAFGAVSVLAGVVVGRRLWGPGTGYVFGLLYVACPFALVYDRLALTDPPMAAFAALALLFTVRLHEEPRPGRALLLSLALVGAVLTKATALLVVVIPLAGLLLLAPLQGRRVRAFVLAILAAAALLFWPVVRFFATTSTVRLGVGHRDTGLTARLATNVPMALSWLLTYLTGLPDSSPNVASMAACLSLALLVLVGLVLDMRERPRPVLFLFSLVGVPVLAFAAVSTLWFPRYLVFVIVPALLLVARGLVRLLEPAPRWAQAFALVAVLAPALGLDRDILLEPSRAALPDIDREQYVLGWPSGYGTDGTLAFVHEELQHHPDGLTVVANVHSRRTTWLALGLEFAREPRVDLRDLDLTQPQNLDLLAAWAHARPTLLVVSPVGPAHAQPEPLTWAHLGGLVLRSCKPDGESCDEVYRLDASREEASPPS
jgi:Dolichyl-phosphate-mannose-protein mannosyltransferase